MRITIKNKSSGNGILIFETSPLEGACYNVWDSQRDQPRPPLSEYEQRRRAFANKTRDLFVQLVVRDGAACAKCGSTEKLTVDHIAPMIRGGSDDLSNLQILCKRCNSSKRDR